MSSPPASPDFSITSPVNFEQLAQPHFADDPLAQQILAAEKATADLNAAAENAKQQTQNLIFAQEELRDLVTEAKEARAATIRPIFQLKTMTEKAEDMLGRKMKSAKSEFREELDVIASEYINSIEDKVNHSIKKKVDTITEKYRKEFETQVADWKKHLEENITGLLKTAFGDEMKWFEDRINFKVAEAEGSVDAFAEDCMQQLARFKTDVHEVATEAIDQIKPQFLASIQEAIDTRDAARTPTTRTRRASCPKAPKKRRQQ